MDCNFKQENYGFKKTTKRELLDRKLSELNSLLGLRKGKYGYMIHTDNAYGGYSLVGYSAGSGDRGKHYSDYSSGAITDISLYQQGRMSMPKTIELVSTMIKTIEYAARVKSGQE